ncbi:hypothetical protein [Mesorhizobium sp.]|uniref:hypothetical protein n=1 Tax=Mesorhizobium sp. TaxID=1871066 RepID=UPI00257A4C55|nr:hypothetical protein [Mesorhizobium sp.]
MTEELPNISRVELALAEFAGKAAAPLLRGGMSLEEALAIAYPIAAKQLIEAGEEECEVETALIRQLDSAGTLPEHKTVAISEPIHAALMESFERALETLPEGPVRLDEAIVKANTGFKMILYPNESQHAGFPHLKVRLQDGDINISIEDEPRVVAGKRGLRGEAAALRAVKDHKKSLLDEWHATRPDDQKLEAAANTAKPNESKSERSALALARRQHFTACPLVCASFAS